MNNTKKVSYQASKAIHRLYTDNFTKIQKIGDMQKLSIEKELSQLRPPQINKKSLEMAE